MDYQIYTFATIGIFAYIIFQDRNVSEYIELLLKSYYINTVMWLIKTNIYVKIRYQQFLTNQKLNKIKKKLK